MPQSAAPRPTSLPSVDSAGRRARAASALGVALVTAVVFLPVLRNDFVNWDDDLLLVNNRHFRGFGWANIRWMFTTFHSGPYQPLSWLTYALDYKVWGLNPLGYHLTNLLLHAASAAACFLVARRLLHREVPDARAGLPSTAAAAAALFFALHPLRVESVAWATERRDVLSGLLLLLAVLAYLRYADAAAVVERRRRYVAALALFSLSLLAKASGMMLPVALLILDWYPLRRFAAGPAAVPRLLLEKVPFAAASAAFAVLALAGQSRGAALTTLTDLSLLDRLMLAGHAAMFYVWKTLLPLGLGPRYEGVFPFNPWQPRFVVGSAFTIALCVLAFVFRRRRPSVAAAWAAFLVLLAPVSGLVQAGSQIAADRYTYLPCLPFALLVGAGLLRLAAPRAAAAGAAVWLLLLAALSMRQVGFWRDSEALWSRALAVDPNCSYAHCNLSTWYSARGDLEQALHHGALAVRLRPRDADALRNYGVFLEMSGRADEARAALERAAAMDTATADVVIEYGAVLFRAGRLDEAEPVFRRAVRRDPEAAKALFALGLIGIHAGRLDEATGLIDRAIDTAELPAEAFDNLATAWLEVGRTEAAVAALRRGLRDFPGHNALESRLAGLTSTRDVSSGAD